MGPAASGHTDFLPDGSQRRLAADCVAAGFAASGAVPKTVGAETDVQLALTKHTVLFALAAFFDLLALAATNFGFGCGHSGTVAPVAEFREVPLVTMGLLSKSLKTQRAQRRTFQTFSKAGCSGGLRSMLPTLRTPRRVGQPRFLRPETGNRRPET